MIEGNADGAGDDRGFKPITVRILDACHMTGIGRSKLYELIESGDIAIIKVGRITLIRVSELEAFVEGRASAQRPCDGHRD